MNSFLTCFDFTSRGAPTPPGQGMAAWFPAWRSRASCHEQWRQDACQLARTGFSLNHLKVKEIKWMKCPEMYLSSAPLFWGMAFAPLRSVLVYSGLIWSVQKVCSGLPRPDQATSEFTAKRAGLACPGLLPQATGRLIPCHFILSLLAVPATCLGCRRR